MIPKARTSDTLEEKAEGSGRREAWGGQRSEKQGRGQDDVERKTRPGTDRSGPWLS